MQICIKGPGIKSPEDPDPPTRQEANSITSAGIWQPLFVRRGGAEGLEGPQRPWSERGVGAGAWLAAGALRSRVRRGLMSSHGRFLTTILHEHLTHSNKPPPFFPVPPKTLRDIVRVLLVKLVHVVSHATRSQPPCLVSRLRVTPTAMVSGLLTVQLDEEVFPRIVSLSRDRLRLSLPQTRCQKMGRGSRQVAASPLRNIPPSALTSSVPPPSCSSSHSHLAAAESHYVALHWHLLQVVAAK
ncbi:hypothetical protein J7T55_010251 [Diaporthe amygdali]|uniref:uncharacterized protein n=1 Tax=Phomopsis amygdali TaxID=1214568 RepID=UPI0022FEE977|nr:uncharacterized protein J7T55_010251 [Diaporthe amygdali]KAJ0114007.1 hypothetical protein J7T55_010251 [Diaporthe amygdali]